MPKAPKSTLANERFMALLIIKLRQEAGRAVERARDDQHLVVERKARRRRRPDLRRS